SNVLADGEVEVMSGQVRPRVARSMPELGEARININVSFATQAAQERFVSQMATDVQKEIGAVRQFEQLSQAQAVHLRAVLIDQRRGAGQAKLLGNLLEVSQVHRLFKRRDGSG